MKSILWTIVLGLITGGCFAAVVWAVYHTK